MRLPDGSSEDGEKRPRESPLCPPRCFSVPLPLTRAFVSGSEAELRGRDWRCSRCAVGGATSRQAGRALPARPVRFLAAPRHPPPAPAAVGGDARCSPLTFLSLEGTRPPRAAGPHPGRGGGPHARPHHGDRLRREPGRLAQDAAGPRSPGSRPLVLVAVAFADLAWPSLPRLDLRFCMWVDWAEPVAVWTCVRPPQVDQPQVDQPCDLGAPSAGRAVSWAAPGKCVAWWLSASEVLPWSSPSLVLWLPGSRQRWPAAARWPSSLETLGAEQGGKTVPCPLSGSGRGQCAHSDRRGGQLLAPLHSRLRAPSLPLKQVQQSWGALTVGDFIS